MVFQEPMVSLNPAMTVGAQLAEGLALHTRLRPAEIRSACVAMLDRIGIADPVRCLAAYPHEFSGGMRQRIMLASVMLLKPKLLIADEPTTALDTLTQAEVLKLMVELTAEHGTAVMLITHNLGLVARHAERAIVMKEGRIVEQGTAADILQRPRQDYTRALVAACRCAARQGRRRRGIRSRSSRRGGSGSPSPRAGGCSPSARGWSRSRAPTCRSGAARWWPWSAARARARPRSAAPC